MKEFYNLLLLVSLLIIFFICLPVHAQGDPGDPCNDPSAPVQCPIDGGLTALLAIGVGYGIKKYKDSKSQSSELDNKVSE